MSMCELVSGGPPSAKLSSAMDPRGGEPLSFPVGEVDDPLRSGGIVGSSRALRQVMQQLDAVASTDATVLITGGFGPQPHPDFVEVFVSTAVGGGHGAVAGAGERRY